MMILFAVCTLVILITLLACQLILLRRPAMPAVDLAAFLTRVDAVERALCASLDRLDRGQREDLASSRRESREELERVRGLLDQKVNEMRRTICENLQLAAEQSMANRRELREDFERVRGILDGKLTEMRRTVDEKLQETLDKRLTESFQRVSERLEQVYKGLGEMQALALEVGDVKRALSNVRTRGTWGEVQAGSLLDEVLSPDQFGRNVAITGTAERVEFAIKMPGQDTRQPVWLPIDAKFPLEDYLRLVDAGERGDPREIEAYGKKLEDCVRECAKSISRKYLAPPLTTDFAILYLPTESLYAEVLRRSGVVESLQRDFRVTVAGPTTLCAFLNSLKLGFRTLAIQQRSGEVWGLLGEVKTEFGRYSDVLAKVQKKLQEAANTVDTGLVRTRAIERRLRNVQELPAADEREEEKRELPFLAAGD